MKKKIFCGLASFLLMLSASFAQKATFSVQGHSRPDLPPPAATKTVSVQATESETPSFTFDSIRFWIGEGTNRAALVIDWYDEKLDHALVWGYRWDGEATGYDMVAAIAKTDPRMILLTHETNLGYTIAGLGYNEHQPYETELVYTPKDGSPVSHKPKNGIVTTDAYNYDNWTCSDTNALWRSGWYGEGYWSYQVKDAMSDEFAYSNWGASSRTLTDGCVDGWSFASLNNTTEGSLPRTPYEAVSPMAEPSDENAYWGQMYMNPEHQSIIDLPLAIEQNQLSVKWEIPYTGYSGQPIIAGDYMYNTTGKKICKYSVIDGSLVAEQEMLGSIGFFSMIAYGDGKIFVTLGSGLTQAFDAITLKPLWQSKVEVGGQQLCPIVYHDGYIYTGTWNGGTTSTGVFYCISTEDDDPDSEDEIKTPVWQSSNTGFYWSGGTIVGNCIFVGGDDGVMRSYNRLTGAVIDEWEVAPELEVSHIRSGTSYDEKTGRLFFTGREARKIYSVKINPDGTFDHSSKLVTDVAGQATTTPTVYNGRVYATSGTMDSGGGLDVFDAETLQKIYSVDMGGISQSTPVVSTAFATEENHHEVYIYVCLNNRTGDLVCLKDFEGNTEPIIQYKWQAPKTQYCTHSVVVDQYGTLYYKNDSRGFWALSSKGVSLDHSAKIKLGDQLSLTPRLVFIDNNKNVNWKSTDESVATVNAEGVVMAVAVGDAKIIVTTEVGGYTDTCAVSVFAPLTSLAFQQKSKEMNVGDEETLQVNLQPAGSIEDLVWTSLNTTIATVDAEGKVTAVAAGETQIIVATQDGRLSDTCLVKVSAVAVTGVNIIASTTTVGKNGLQLTATIVPANATNKNVSWASSNTAIATVSETGKVTAVTPGTVTITVTTEDGNFTATQEVTVDIVPVTGVTISQKTLDLVYKGSNFRLSATVEPADATINTVTYESTDESVATATNYGWVNPQGVGTAKVIVRTVNGNFTDTCVVTVEEVHVAGIQLSNDTLRIEDGKNKTLTVTFTPTAVSNKTMTWISTDEAVATVSATYNGASVKPTGNGEAKIIGTTEDGGFADTCVVIVTNQKEPIAVTGVSISNKSLTLILGKSGRMLTAKVLPDTAANKNVSWKSLNEEVATVSEKGSVAAIAPGEAKLVVTTQDGGFTDTCTVTVKALVTGVTLDKTEAELTIGGEALQLTATITPANATDKSVTWTSSNEAVATVSTTGLVTAVAVGEADITATTTDGGFTAVCKVTVKAAPDPTVAVTGISLNKQADSLYIGDSLVLVATVMPEDATNKACTWASSDTEVASVSETGVVKALAVGQSTITVSTLDGNFTATCQITVRTVKDTTGGNDTIGEDPTAIKDLQPLALSMYPNPTTSEFHIKIAEPALIEAFTLSGHLVFRKEAPAGLHTFAPERSGLYLIRLSSGTRTTVVRAIKQ